MTVAHIASVRIEAPANYTFEQLSDAGALSRWALGCMGLLPTGVAGVFRGISLFDGSEAFVEIRNHPNLGLIDYHVGTLAARSPRISIRVAAGTELGLGNTCCLAAMTAWRTSEMDEARWARTCTTHELEALLFKAQIEAAWLKKGPS